LSSWTYIPSYPVPDFKLILSRFEEVGFTLAVLGCVDFIKDGAAMLNESLDCESIMELGSGVVISVIIPFAMVNILVPILTTPV
jgi:hypothetical protein